MRVVLYSRIAHEGSLDKLKEQNVDLINYAKRNNLDVVGEYSDVGFDRTGYNKMLSELDNVDLVLVTKISRISRKYKEFLKFISIMEQTNTKWATIDERYNSMTTEGRFYINIMLSIVESFEKGEGL